MINRVLARLRRPEKGWDPIPPAYAAEYSDRVWAQGVDEAALDDLERRLGGFAGKRVLDLGAGPGHYTVAFAKRKALATWHDVSRAYRAIAGEKAAAEGVTIAFNVGDMDDAAGFYSEPFDLVFNRICWYYCRDDRAFAQTMFGLVKPGGIGYIDTMHSGANPPGASMSLRLRTWLNDRFGIKIGHPYPPHGRIEELFRELPVESVLADYSDPSKDRVLFVKKRTAA